MTILDKLSSRMGDKTEASNKRVVSACLHDPELLLEISRGLSDRDDALVGDCAEVLTETAKENPDLILRFIPDLHKLLEHKKSRPRWEAMHCLALTAALKEDVIKPVIHKIHQIIRNDKSVIVRDYAVDAIGNYARNSAMAAKEAFPILVETLDLWDGKQAHHALRGMHTVSEMLPEHNMEIKKCAEKWVLCERVVVARAAKDLIRFIDRRQS